MKAKTNLALTQTKMADENKNKEEKVVLSDEKIHNKKGNKREFESNVTGEKWFKHTSKPWKKVINQFAIMGAESFPDIPYEELYDLEKDPYQKVNLINDKEYKKIRKRLTIALVDWMKSQGDFLLNNPIAILKPTLHPLDKNSN